MNEFLIELGKLLKKYNVKIDWSNYYNDFFFRIGNKKTFISDLENEINKLEK